MIIYNQYFSAMLYLTTLLKVIQMWFFKVNAKSLYGSFYAKPWLPLLSNECKRSMSYDYCPKDLNAHYSYSTKAFIPIHLTSLHYILTKLPYIYFRSARCMPHWTKLSSYRNFHCSSKPSYRKTFHKENKDLYRE